MARLPVARNYRGAGFRIGKLAFSEFKRDLSGINLIVIDHFTQQLRDFFRGEHGGFKIDRNMLLRMLTQPVAHIFEDASYNQ